MTPGEEDWHRLSGTSRNGPTVDDLWQLSGGGPEGHNKKQLRQLHVELRKMRYTNDGEGCRIVKTTKSGRVPTYTQPGPDYLPPGSARNALDAANTNQFYPNMPRQILIVCPFQQHFCIPILTKYRRT